MFIQFLYHLAESAQIRVFQLFEAVNSAVCLKTPHFEEKCCNLSKLSVYTIFTQFGKKCSNSRFRVNLAVNCTVCVKTTKLREIVATGPN